MNDKKPNDLVEKLLSEAPVDPQNVGNPSNDDDDSDTDSDGTWSEEEFREQLDNAISEVIPNARCRSYRDVGMLTNNEGLVVHTPQGEFQVTIVRRR